MDDLQLALSLPAESVPLVQAMLAYLMESERKRLAIESEMQQIQKEHAQLKKSYSGLQRQIADRKIVELKPPAHTSDLNVVISSNCAISSNADIHGQAGHYRHNSFNSNPRSIDEDEDVLSCSINELFNCGANFRSRHFSHSSHRESRTPIDDATAEQLSSLKLQTFFGVEMEDDTKTAVRHLASNTSRKRDPPSDAPVDEKAAASLSSMKMQEFFGVEMAEQRINGRLPQTAHHLSNNQQRKRRNDERSRPPKARSARASAREKRDRRRAQSANKTRSPTNKLKMWFKSSSCTPKSAKSKRNRQRRKENRSCDMDRLQLRYDFSNLLCDDYDADYEDVEVHNARTPRNARSAISRLRRAKQSASPRPRRQLLTNLNRVLSDPTSPSKISLIDDEDLICRLALDDLECGQLQSGPADLRRSTPTDYLSPLSGACVLSPHAHGSKHELIAHAIRSPSSGSAVANARNSLLMNRSRSCQGTNSKRSAKKMYTWKE